MRTYSPSLLFSPSLVVAFDTVVTQDSFLLQIHVVFCQPVACVINRERERERLFLVQFERMHLRERVKNEGHKTDRQNCLWFFLSLFSLSLSAYLYQRHSLFLFIIQALNGFLIFGIKTISTTTLGATTFGATTFSTTTLGTMTFSITTLGTMTLGTMTISIKAIRKQAILVLHIGLFHPKFSQSIYWRGRLNTVDLFVPSSLNQLLFSNNNNLPFLQNKT
jgi:hypothetical protein